MLDPGSAADWLQASLMTGALAGLAAAGRWALTREQHERSVAPSPTTNPGATVLPVGTESGGVHHAHLTTTGGQRITVDAGKGFKATGLQSAPHHS